MQGPYKVLVVTMWFINLKSAVNKRLSKFLCISLAGILTIISSILLFTSQPADATHEIKIAYGSLNIPISIAELVTFAEIGEQSDQLKSLFLTANASV